MRLNPFGRKAALKLETERFARAEAERHAAARTMEVDALTVRVTEAQALIRNLEQEVKEAPYRAREALVGTHDIRVGWKDLDLMKMQARIRAVEPSLRIEREEFRWIIYSARALEQSQLNRLESVLGFKLERD